MQKQILKRKNVTQKAKQKFVHALSTSSLTFNHHVWNKLNVKDMQMIDARFQGPYRLAANLPKSNTPQHHLTTADPGSATYLDSYGMLPPPSLPYSTPRTLGKAHGLTPSAPTSISSACTYVTSDGPPPTTAMPASSNGPEPHPTTSRDASRPQYRRMSTTRPDAAETTPYDDSLAGKTTHHTTTNGSYATNAALPPAPKKAWLYTWDENTKTTATPSTGLRGQPADAARPSSTATLGSSSTYGPLPDVAARGMHGTQALRSHSPTRNYWPTTSGTARPSPRTD
eukprot:9499577-Pyramimonas_sp.AAC.1